MRKDKIIKKLKSLKGIQNKIKALEMDLRFWENKALRYSTSDIDRKSFDSIVVEKIIPIQSEILSKLDKLKSEKDKIESLIELCNETEYSVLSAHFISGLPFEKVAENLNYSERQVYRIYDNAINQIQQRVNNEALMRPGAPARERK